MNLPRISIIVVCYNEEKNIEKCLYSLLSQVYPPDKYEILIIDNGSTDQTRPLINKIKSRNKKVKLFINPTIGISKSRNLGLLKSRYPYVAFIDADCVAPKNWLKILSTRLASLSKKDARVIAAGGANLPPKDATFFQKSLAISRSSFLIHHGSVQGKSYHQERFVEHLPTVNVLYLKKPIIQIGKFDESFGNIAEDLELSWRLSKKGFRFIYLPSSFVYHQLDKNLLAFLRKVFRYGKGRVWFFKKHPAALEIRFFFPAFLVLFLFLLIFSPTLSPLRFNLSTAFFFYLLILLVSTFYLCFKHKNFSFFLQVFLIFLTSLPVYGLGEFYGLFSHPSAHLRN